MLAHVLRRPRMLAVLPCCIGLALAGCTGRLEPTTRPSLPQTDVSPAAPAGSGSAQIAATATVMQDGRYPLATGNTWEHLLTTTYRLIPNVGEPPPAETIESVVRRRHIGPVNLGGRVYMAEEIQPEGPIVGWYYSILYRQDASGLYEYAPIRLAAAAGSRAKEDGRPDAAATTHARAIARLLAARPPAERAAFEAAARRLASRIAALGRPVPRIASTGALRRLPGTEGPYELTRLRYPLEPKTRWIVRSFYGTPFTAEVITAETLELPAGKFRGHRIRLRGGFLGDDDSSEIWFGPSGYLQSIAHIEEVATDVGGNIVGRWTGDHRETLLDLHLVNSSIVDLPPWYPRPHK